MLHRSGCLTERWQFRCDDAVISIAATANCSTIAATTVGKSLYLLNSEGTELWRKTSLDHEGWSTAVSADGTTIAVGTACKNPADGTVYVYNSQGDQLLAYVIKADFGKFGVRTSVGRFTKHSRDELVYKLI